MVEHMTYRIGDKAIGTVTGIQPYGIFVQLDKTQQGLIHISELNHGFVANIENQFKLGDKIEVQVIDIDEYTKKISLSVRSLKSLNIPKRPKKLGRPSKRKTPEIGFQAIAEKMPEWIAEGLENIKEYKIKETNNDTHQF